MKVSKRYAVISLSQLFYEVVDLTGANIVLLLHFCRVYDPSEVQGGNVALFSGDCTHGNCVGRAEISMGSSSID